MEVLKLPNGWIETNLGRILKLKNGYAFKSATYSSEGTPLIRISNIKSEKIIIDNNNCIPDHLYDERYLVEKGDILIAMSGATTGKYGIYNFDTPSLQNQRVGNFKLFSDNINKSFIYYLIGVLKKDIEEKAYGGAQPNISSKLIEELRIPLPPRPEQDRIVAKVDSLMGQVSVMQESLQRIPLLLKDFRQTLLNQNYSSGSNRVALEDCCFKIQDGAHHSPKKLSVIREKSMYPYVTSKNIRNNYMKLDTLTYVNESFHNSIYPRCKPELGDVLLTKDGASTGNVTLNEFNEPISLLSSVCLIKTDKEKLIPSYLKFFIQSPIGFSEFTGQMTGTAIKRVVLKKIKKATIPLPSIKEQQEIVSRVESLFSKADAIQQQYEALKQKIDSLPQAILHKAFKGELVEQLESDGDARELLREIEKLKKK